MTSFIFVMCLLFAAAQIPATQPGTGADPRELLLSDDFSRDAGHWIAELENGGTVAVRDGCLDINVPAGCTVWLRAPLEGPVMIQYDATVIQAGGANDRVSDLNCFWMARDARSPDDLFKSARTGKFADYDQLRCYYVGFGGNGNTTTRFRRYIGEKDNRPLLPEHDLKSPLITPNVSQKIELIASGNLIQFIRDGQKLFELNDPHPYTSGWFGFRTVANHLQIRNFKVYRLKAL